MITGFFLNIFNQPLILLLLVLTLVCGILIACCCIRNNRSQGNNSGHYALDPSIGEGMTASRSANKPPGYPPHVIKPEREFYV
uniref:Uncharacterized protein n=1 Tax=Ditylenchus dipsaci TaxID=166011 RepID=A0A915CR26_9BILA